MILLQLWIRDVDFGKLRRVKVKADAVLIDGIIVDDDAVQKSRAHFILVVPTILYGDGDLQRGCRVEDGCCSIHQRYFITSTTTKPRKIHRRKMKRGK